MVNSNCEQGWLRMLGWLRPSWRLMAWKGRPSQQGNRPEKGTSMGLGVTDCITRHKSPEKGAAWLCFYTKHTQILCSISYYQCSIFGLHASYRWVLKNFSFEHNLLSLAEEIWTWRYMGKIGYKQEIKRWKTSKRKLRWLPICRKDWHVLKKPCTRCMSL